MKLGEFLIAEKIITEEQLHKALEFQKTNPVCRIGEILLKMNYVSEKKLVECLLRHNSKLMLGELLYFTGVISKEQLKKAIERQQTQTHPQPIGQILLADKAINESQLHKYLVMQNNSKKLDFQNFLHSIDDLLKNKVE